MGTPKPVSIRVITDKKRLGELLGLKADWFNPTSWYRATDDGDFYTYRRPLNCMNARGGKQSITIPKEAVREVKDR